MSFLPFILPVLLSFLTNFSGIALMGCSAWLITRAAEHPELSVLAVAVVGVRFFGLSKAVFRYAERMSSHATTFERLTHIRASITKKMIHAQNAPITNMPSAEILGRFLRDVEILGDGFIRGSYPLVNSLLACCVLWTCLLLWDLKIGAVAVIFHALLGIFLPALLALVRIQKTKLFQKSQSRMRAHFGNTVLLRDDYRASGTLQQALISLESMAREQTANKDFSSRLQALQNLLMQSGQLASTVFTLILLAPSVSQNTMGPAEAAAFLFVVFASFELSSPTAQAFEVFYEAHVARGRIAKLLTMDSPSVTAVPRVNSLQEDAIVASHISHKYPNAVEHALENLNARIPSKTTTLLTGPSGSGKSTFINLIIGTLETQSGTITLSTPRMAAARHRDHVFAASLRFHLLLAKPTATEKELLGALNAAHLSEWVNSLPQKLDTILGDGGSTLSGGERQRLLLARAILTAPSILCIDECTGHLPATLESSILESLSHPQEKTQTLLVATHRVPSTQNVLYTSRIFF
jgi:ATP-binding cassette subfamily C protein CydC